MINKVRGKIMIFRQFKNNEEISFCNVDTPEEALELFMDPMSTDYDEIMEHMKPTIYGFMAALGNKPDGEPGDIWDIKAFASAEAKEPMAVRHVKIPIEQLSKIISKPDKAVIGYMKEAVMKGTDNLEKWVKENPKKASEILKAFNKNMIDTIIQGS
ncbi:MAG: hypothetical protein PHZ02_01230 [Desulfocapsaceae bacterium]|nr:hypothetical protein [Desulfocapsaceae bacterium]